MQLGYFLGLSRVELLTPALSEQCSNQLSYRPVTKFLFFYKKIEGPESGIKVKNWEELFKR